MLKKLLVAFSFIYFSYCFLTLNCFFSPVCRPDQVDQVSTPCVQYKGFGFCTSTIDSISQFMLTNCPVTCEFCVGKFWLQNDISHLTIDRLISLQCICNTKRLRNCIKTNINQTPLPTSPALWSVTMNGWRNVLVESLSEIIFLLIHDSFT